MFWRQVNIVGGSCSDDYQKPVLFEKHKGSDGHSIANEELIFFRRDTDLRRQVESSIEVLDDEFKRMQVQCNGNDNHIEKLQELNRNVKDMLIEISTLIRQKYQLKNDSSFVLADQCEFIDKVTSLISKIDVHMSLYETEKCREEFSLFLENNIVNTPEKLNPCFIDKESDCDDEEDFKNDCSYFNKKEEIEESKGDHMKIDNDEDDDFQNNEFKENSSDSSQNQEIEEENNDDDYQNKGSDTNQTLEPEEDEDDVESRLNDTITEWEKEKLTKGQDMMEDKEEQNCSHHNKSDDHGVEPEEENLHVILHELISTLGQLNQPTNHDILDTLWHQLPEIEGVHYPTRLDCVDAFDRQSNMLCIMTKLYEGVSNYAMKSHKSTSSIYEDGDCLKNIMSDMKFTHACIDQSHKNVSGKSMDTFNSKIPQTNMEIASHLDFLLRPN